jgi:hypothetical protein
MVDLAGIIKNINMGKNGVMPSDPMKVGVDLSNAPYVFLAMLGEFKGETGIRRHIVALASYTMLGIELRWWIEKLISIREKEGCLSGPAFGYSDGSVAAMSEYDSILHRFLALI